MNKTLCLIVWLFIALNSYSQIRLPAVINNNMVLQQQSKVALWGWCSATEKITVTPSWSSKADTTSGNSDGKWKIYIQTPPAGGPYTITLKGYNQITLDNILIGEVWVCSGQSNMQFGYYQGFKDVKQELPNCYNNNIRFFNIPQTTAAYPQDDCKAQWAVCDSNTLKSFSAVGYFFGKDLNKSLNVPIGLVNSSWGGTAAEVWTPSDDIAKDSVLKIKAARLTPAPWWPVKPGYAYNAMIAPVTNFTITGVIWYQGESNALFNAADTYPHLFKTMMDAWRNSWAIKMPFYYVQIAPFNYPNKNAGPLLQEAQVKSMDEENTGMVVITDLVEDPNNVHPQNKHDVGLRLANYALAKTYNKTGVIYKSPVYKSMLITNGKAIISFDTPGIELYTKGDTVKELFIAGDDKIFYPAEAKILKDKLIVQSKNVKQPVAVRYAFSNTAIGNLFSKQQLPVSPFRTDNWEIDTSPVGKAH